MESMFIRWAKAFAVYFCIVVTLHSMIEFLYAHSIFQMPMLIMGVSIPSAYIYGLTLGLVLSVAHFVLGKTIQKGREHVIREHLAAKNKELAPQETKKKKAGRKKK
ncbi:Uncharacterised protein [uncultured archaeon]|nr:Uncharacterised protein [uncultured archaeon]